MESIREIVGLEAKQQFWPLLLLADPDEGCVKKYLAAGRMFVLDAEGAPACEAVVFARDDGQLELKNLATDPAFQRRGYAGRMIAHIRATFRGQYEKLYVGTAREGLYERWGFRYAYTVKDFFVDNYPEPVYDGDWLCVDMIYYEIEMG